METYEPKITIRLLPPTLNRSEFENQLRHYTDKKYQSSYYVEGRLPENPYEVPKFSVCYISFKNSTESTEFVQEIKGKHFSDANEDAFVPQITSSLNKAMIAKTKTPKPPTESKKSSLEGDGMFLKFKKMYEKGEQSKFNLSDEMNKLKGRVKKERRKTVPEKKKVGRAKKQAEEQKKESKRVINQTKNSSTEGRSSLPKPPGKRSKSRTPNKEDQVSVESLKDKENKSKYPKEENKKTTKKDDEKNQEKKGNPKSKSTSSKTKTDKDNDRTKAKGIKNSVIKAEEMQSKKSNKPRGNPGKVLFREGTPTLKKDSRSGSRPGSNSKQDNTHEPSSSGFMKPDNYKKDVK